MNSPIRKTIINFLTTWQRWLNIGIRSLHIGFGALLFGGIFYRTSAELYLPWHHLAIGSGIILLLLEWFHDRAWPHRVMGIVVYLHVILGALIHLWPDMALPLLWAVIISGSIGSHMPRRFRHWSLLHGPEDQKKS